MHLSDEALAEFRTIWREEHPNEPVSDEALRDMATRVLRAVSAVFEQIPSDSLDDRRPLDGF